MMRISGMRSSPAMVSGIWYLPRMEASADPPRTVKFALGENPKRSPNRYPNTRMGVQEIIRDHFLAARDDVRRDLPPLAEAAPELFDFLGAHLHAGLRAEREGVAPRPGLEPGTCGLTVRRSTN